MKSRIKDLLKEKRITLSELADKLKISQGSLSRALGENGNPTYDTLIKISDALDVDITELFGTSKGQTITCPNCGHEIAIELKTR